VQGEAKCLHSHTLGERCVCRFRAEGVAGARDLLSVPGVKIRGQPVRGHGVGFPILGAVYEGDWIRPWFASNVGEGHSSAKCLITPQRRQVYRISAASVRDEAGASVAGLATYGFGS